MRPPHRKNNRLDGSSLLYPGLSRYLFAKYAWAIGIPMVQRIPVGNIMGSNKPVDPIIVEIDVPRPRKNTGLTPSLIDAFHPRVQVHSTGGLDTSGVVASGVLEELSSEGAGGVELMVYTR